MLGKQRVSWIAFIETEATRTHQVGWEKAVFFFFHCSWWAWSAERKEQRKYICKHEELTINMWVTLNNVTRISFPGHKPQTV